MLELQHGCGFPVGMEDSRTWREFRSFVGGRVGRECRGETDQMLCGACGQVIDMRDLAAIAHHETDGHEPLPLDTAERLTRIDDALASCLQRNLPGATTEPT